MSQEESKILDKVGKDAGFKVPEGYFENFTEQMMAKLPEAKLTPVVKPTLWHRMRPLVYMAAMFAGIWCMMRIFNDLSGVSNDAHSPQAIIAGMENEQNMDELIMSDGVLDYDIMNYDDSVAASDDDYQLVPVEP